MRSACSTQAQSVGHHAAVLAGLVLETSAASVHGQAIGPFRCSLVQMCAASVDCVRLAPPAVQQLYNCHREASEPLLYACQWHYAGLHLLFATAHCTCCVVLQLPVEPRRRPAATMTRARSLSCGSVSGQVERMCIASFPVHPAELRVYIACMLAGGMKTQLSMPLAVQTVYLSIHEAKMLAAAGVDLCTCIDHMRMVQAHHRK